MKSFSDNYILRIYRFEENNPRALVGLVEEVGQKGKKAFTSFYELSEILNPPERRLPGVKEKTGKTH